MVNEGNGSADGGAAVENVALLNIPAQLDRKTFVVPRTSVALLTVPAQVDLKTFVVPWTAKHEKLEQKGREEDTVDRDALTIASTLTKGYFRSFFIFAEVSPPCFIFSHR